MSAKLAAIVDNFLECSKTEPVLTRDNNVSSPYVAVIGLGYVGLPLALALARHYTVIAYDISVVRITELKNNVDVTEEISTNELATSELFFTNNTEDIAGADYLIITVPTPVDSQNRPNLSHVLSACQIIGQGLKKGAIVVLESTVYPGVTENICGPELETVSGSVSYTHLTLPTKRIV